mgnify:CR=1 FL=1
MIDRRIHLQLYITGETSRSEKAIINLRRIAEVIRGRGIETEIIDVLEDPDRAEKDKILATPTLIRRQPFPERRIIGDLRNVKRVMRILGLEESSDMVEEDQDGSAG